MIRRSLLLMVVVLTVGIATSNGQIVNIPDASFKSYLVGHNGINTNRDNEIQLSEAQSYTGAIDCGNSGIADMTGIEAFTALTVLQCNDNLLTSLDLSNNTALTRVLCNDNSLTSLNVSNCTALTDLGCNGNSLTALDVSGCTALRYLGCYGNSLVSLDLRNNTALTSVLCGKNSLISLNLGNNVALGAIACSDNSLTSLNVSSCTALISLSCSKNSLISLDLSNNTALTMVSCDYNRLTSLNVKNGNNTNFISFSTTGNSRLACIEVDDEVYSNANWTGTGFQFNAGVRFSEDCKNSSSVNEIFNEASFTVYPNPAKELVTISNIPDGSIVSIMDLTGKPVYHSVAADGQTTITTADFANGIYHIRIDRNGNTANRKLIVNR